MWKWVRVFVLLMILATVAQSTWLNQSRATAWKDSLRVAIYPINGDGSEATDSYLRTLSPASFKPMEDYFEYEARRYGVDTHRVVDIDFLPQVATRPPQSPLRANALEAIWWSLRFRFWAWRNDSVPGIKPQVRLFVLFYDPRRHPVLSHSTGLQKGMIGVVSVFASREMAGSNSVVIAHELLHTLGATDKYDLASNQPIFPSGYADPGRNPRYPQDFAELMGGRIPLSGTQAEIPEALENTLVGVETAAEIGWVKRQ